MGREELRIKHAAEDPSPDDGARVLVDRRWPEGLPRENADIVLWLQSAAPSERLRAWYREDPARWEEFRDRYRGELENREEELRRLEGMARGGRLTLVHAGGEGERSPATVLRAVLEERLAETG